jgi:hypothetical protein
MVWPATVAVALRLLVESFACTWIETVPFPVPFDGETVNQPAFETALQEQVLPVLTATERVCPE